jgi:signal transduction histidine kinase/DNA-binding response OmpR family regulator
VNARGRRAALRERLLASTILLVDDEEANLDLLEAVLEAEGYTALVRIDDPRTLMDVVAKHPPDVVLLDLHMPHRHGLDVLQELQAALPPDEFLPVLVLTADATPTTKERALRAGAHDFLTKPFDTLEVALRVENLLETRLLYADQHNARRAAEEAEARAALLAEWSRRLGASLDATTALAQLPGMLVPRWGDACVVLDCTGDEILATARDDDGESPPRGLDAAALTARGRAANSDDESAPAAVQLTECENLSIATAAVTLGLPGAGESVATIVLARADARIAPDVQAMLAELARRAGLAAERARLFAAAERATRERERLLAVVAHDLRNPLSVVAMYAEMVHDPRRAGIAGDDVAFQQAIATIHRTTSGMQALVEDLLDAATVHDGALKLHLDEHDAAELFTQAEHMLRPLAVTRGISLVVEEARAGDVDALGARIRADAGRLSQVLSNLVGNAIKFSPPNGTVAVRWTASEDGLTVRVTDQGEGIAPHMLPHLFSAYWQGDGFDRRGAGLGLWIARAIVEGHGGAIGVESPPGEGATFSFTLPSRPSPRRWES